MSVRTGPLRWSGLGVLVVWSLGRLLVGVGRVVYLAVCRPRTTAAVVGAVGAVWLLATATAQTIAVVAVTVAVVEAWALLYPVSWRRWGRLRLLCWWRSLVVYRRHWQAAMTVAELTQPGPGGGVRVPRLGRVRCTDTVDVVQVRGLLGQRFAEWEAAGPMLAHVFGARDVRVHRGDDRRLTLELLRGRRGRTWNRDDVLELDARS